MIITRFQKLAAGSVLMIGLTAGAWAATESVVEPLGQTFDLTKIAGGTYAMDPHHAQVVFMINHLGFSAIVGRFNKAEGTLDFDPKDATKSALSVTIDPASIDTTSDELDEHLTKKDFFDVAAYKTITFKSTKVEKLSDRTGRVTGDLTMHGITKPVTLDVTFNGGGKHPMSKSPALGFSARGELKRSDFNITKYDNVVGDRVGLIIECEFIQGKS